MNGNITNSVITPGQAKKLFSKRTKKTQRQKTKIIRLRNYDDVGARLYYYSTAGDKEIIRVKGYGVIRGTSDRADDCVDHQCKVKFGDVAAAERAVIFEIAKDCERGKGNGSGTKELSLYDCLKKIDKYDHDRLIEIAQKTFGWAESTANRTLSYLINSVAFNMIANDTMEGVVQALVDSALANKRSGEHEGATKQNIQTVLIRVEKLFRRLQRDYEEIRRFEMEFPPVYIGQAAITEQEKSLKSEERTLFVYVLWELAQAKFPEAYGAVMMYYCGLRTAEAVGPLIGDIIISDDGNFATYFVSRQIRQGKETNTLKTDKAYRQVVLPFGAVRFVQLRIEQLRQRGYSDKEIEQVPLVSYEDKNSSFVAASVLSGFIKDILQECGVEQERFALVDESEERCVGREERGDMTAYILRRDFTTRGINCCGIMPAEMDYLLGHVSEEVGYERVKAEKGTADWIRSIAQRLDRYVTAPEFSINPAVVPVIVKPGDCVRLMNNTAYQFEAEVDCTIRAVVHNTEAVDHLYLVTEGEYDAKSLRRKTEPEKTGDRMNRIVPAMTNLPPQKYEQLRRRAHDIAERIIQKNQSESEKKQEE